MARTVKIKRFQIGLNVIVQAAVALAIVVMINYFGYTHFKRWDFSRNQKYSLSDQTREILAKLDGTVNFVVFFSGDPTVPGGEIYQDVENLVKECQYASNKKIAVEYVDPFRNFSRARELGAKYKFGAENVVVVDYKGRSKVVNASEMADYDASGAMFGQPPQLKAFTGEQAITSALLEVTEEKQSVVSFLEGQGGPKITDPRLATLKTYLDRQNLKVEPLNLLNVQEIPQETRALVLVSPQYDFSDREITLLGQYWEKQGRLLLALDPAAYTPKLNAFLERLGIKRNDDRVLATVTLAPGLSGIVRDPAADFIGGSPITRKLAGVTTRLVGGTQSLTLDSAAVRTLNIRLQPLLEAVKGFWGETEYKSDEGTPVFFDGLKDHAAPLVIAAAAEKGALEDARVKVDSSRLVAVGNAGFVQTEGLTELNLDFFLNSLNWLLDRQELIGIAPKTSQAFSLNLTETQISRIASLAMAAIPGVVAFVGFVVWWRRRR